MNELCSNTKDLFIYKNNFLLIFTLYQAIYLEPFTYSKPIASTISNINIFLQHFILLVPPLKTVQVWDLRQ